MLPPRHEIPGRLHSLGLCLLVMTLGLFCRLAPLGLPPMFRKWSGSILWGAMFWFLALLLTGGKSLRVTLLLAASGAGASECIKLAHYDALETLRRNRVGHFLLGQQFSWLNLIAYITGIALALVTALALKSTQRN
ncbi:MULTISPECIES: DUF2809 domain-containing protein [Asaia]|nr:MULTISPECIES: DUF2809 domain-containing protein [Asaia]